MGDGGFAKAVRNGEINGDTFLHTLTKASGKTGAGIAGVFGGGWVGSWIGVALGGPFGAVAGAVAGAYVGGIAGGQSGAGLIDLYMGEGRRVDLVEEVNKRCTNVRSDLPTLDLHIGEGAAWAHLLLGEYAYCPNCVSKAGGSQTQTPDHDQNTCMGENCPFSNMRNGQPTDSSCWAASYWWHLQQCKMKGGCMIQIKEGALGQGQKQELAMAAQLGVTVCDFDYKGYGSPEFMAFLRQFREHSP